MRIAVTYENGQIFQHFGHTETFKIYDVEEGKVVHSEIVDTNGSGHGALAGVLKALINASTASSASPETPPKSLMPAAANAVCAPPPIPPQIKTSAFNALRTH